LKWDIVIGSFFTALGLVEELLARSGPSRTFFASLQIEASLIGVAGLAFFVRAALKVRPVARQRVELVVIMIASILFAG
jgi:hypothetical protein